MDRCARRAGLPISVRPFGPKVLDTLLALCGHATELRTLQRAPAWGALRINTTRAALENDGPVWAGRGATLSASAGVLGRWRNLSYSARPIIFWSQNLHYSP